MLVLSRKPGERIVVPAAGIVLTVLEVRGRQVRLGIAAPPELAVHRGEIWAQIQQERAAPPPGRSVTSSAR